MKRSDDAVSIPRLLVVTLGAPVLWALHLSLIYFVITMDCISDWDGGRTTVLIATAVFAVAAAAAGWGAWGMYRGLGGDVGDGGDGGWAAGGEAAHGGHAWARFPLLLGVGAGVLFGVTIVVEGVVPVFVGCG